MSTITTRIRSWISWPQAGQAPLLTDETPAAYGRHGYPSAIAEPPRRLQQDGPDCILTEHPDGDGSWAIYIPAIRRHIGHYPTREDARRAAVKSGYVLPPLRRPDEDDNPNRARNRKYA